MGYMWWLTVLLGIVYFVKGQTNGPEERLLLNYTADFIIEGSRNVMERGILICSIFLPRDRREDSDIRLLQILHNNAVIADTDGMVAEQRYSLETIRGKFSVYSVLLRIEDLSQADSGSYTCKAYGAGVQTLSQASLQFDVNYPPDSLYPTCSMLGSRRPSEPIQIGEPINLLCSSRLGRPTVQLEWQQEKGIDFNLVLHTESEQYVQSEITLDATNRIDGVTFTCISRSEAFPDYRGRCTVGPINIAPPSVEGTTGGMKTDAQQTSAVNINGSTETWGDDVSTSPSVAVECNPLHNNGFPWIIAVVVLTSLLCISLIFNICTVRSRRRVKSVPVFIETNQASDGNYQGLNISAVPTQGPYTPLNTPNISLNSVTKKSMVVNYTEVTAGEEDYAQVNNPESPRSLKDTIKRHQKLEKNADSAYVNLNIPSRSKLR